MSDNITLPRATVQQALEALESRYASGSLERCGDAITALRKALEQQQAEPPQEPKYMVQSNGRHSPLLTHMMNKRTAQPQRKPLTDEEIKAKAMEAFNCYWDGDDETLVNKYGHGVYMSRFTEFARAIEAAHGIKEGT